MKKEEVTKEDLVGGLQWLSQIEYFPDSERGERAKKNLLQGRNPICGLPLHECVSWLNHCHI